MTLESIFMSSFIFMLEKLPTHLFSYICVLNLLNDQQTETEFILIKILIEINLKAHKYTFKKCC